MCPWQIIIPQARKSYWHFEIYSDVVYQGSLIRIQPHVSLRDNGLKDGECVSLLVKDVGGGGDVGSGDDTLVYTNRLLKNNFQLKWWLS